MATTKRSAKQAEIDRNIEYLHDYLHVNSVIVCVLTGYHDDINGNSRCKWQFLAPINGERNNDTDTQGHASAYIITEKVAKVLGYRYYNTPLAPSGIWIDDDVEGLIRNLSRLLFNNDSSLIVVKYS